MEEIISHRDGYGLNDKIVVKCDERDPKAGNAPHRYHAYFRDNEAYGKILDIQFQHGPRHEPRSIAGVTDDVVIAVLIDRLEGFQSGPYACDENQRTLGFLYAARDSMKARATERHNRGVLGKNQK